MYPTVPHDERHYPGISNTNIQLNIPPQAYAAQPEYIVSGRPTYGGVGKWSTGLCHCCDDPANCEISNPIFLNHQFLEINISNLVSFINLSLFFSRFDYLLLPLHHIWTDC